MVMIVTAFYWAFILVRNRIVYPKVFYICYVIEFLQLPEEIGTIVPSIL